MLLQRDNSSRKLQQNKYKQQLYNAIKQKQANKNKSRIVQSSSQPQQKQTFSLIRNIQYQEQKRKQETKRYYQELQMQRNIEIQEKKNRQIAQKQREKMLEEKIKREQDEIRNRYDQEQLRENKKKDLAQDRTKQLQDQLIKKQQQRIEKKENHRKQAKLTNSRPVVDQFPQDSLDVIQTTQQGQQDGQGGHYETNAGSRVSQQMPVSYAYASRIQNQDFNYPERRVLSTNYYRELQLEKRKFEQQTNEIRQLNRYLGAQKSNFSKRSTQGLESLRQLQKMLDHQSISLKQEYGRSKTHNNYNSPYHTSYYDL